MKIDSLIQGYKDFDPYDGGTVEQLVSARQKLSAYLVGMAEQIARAEEVAKLTYHQRKIAEAEQFLSEEGTVAERQAKAIQAELRLQEAKHEGELAGMKLLFESYSKVLDSMASQIRLMSKL